ncbi:uncharacterized protein LOC132751714 [Ruditapes philippinarum]|uniref:uncharacterized protein LOC132751714 n=1 Tax=Ruditapes philippinarum TaxID=129788 RepID=UPI00295B8031|nr:uncharacterized protein LOC132751714 [Ruditapes philippinarum]
MFQRLFVLLFITAVLSEPECSKFHYEEQTLNKMIRQEIAMEKLQTDMASTQQQVIDALGKLTETTQQLRDDWNNERTNLKRVTNELMEENNKSVRNFAAEIERLKGHSVIFRSNDIADLSPTSGKTFVFKTTSLNQGLGYSNRTGIFTAPVAGTYMFSIQLCVEGSHELFYALVVDNENIKIGSFYDTRITTCYNTDTVVVLAKYSNVQVKCLASPCRLHSSGVYWNTFSGVLLKS